MSIAIHAVRTLVASTVRLCVLLAVCSGAHAMSCSADDECNTPVSVTLDGDGCTYVWKEATYFVPTGKQPYLRWTLSDTSKFFWGSNNGITLLDATSTPPASNDARSEGIESGTGDAVFMWTVVHGRPAKKFNVTMEIYRWDNKNRCLPGGSGYIVELQ